MCSNNYHYDLAISKCGRCFVASSEGVQKQHVLETLFLKLLGRLGGIHYLIPLSTLDENYVLMCTSFGNQEDYEVDIFTYVQY